MVEWRAFCALLSAVAFVPATAPAQQVISGEANLLHRGPLEYPVEALEKRIQGTVTIDATLNERGMVTDVHVTSGPEPLRKTVIQSILDWHYRPGTTSPVQVVVDFKRPSVKVAPTPSPPAQQPVNFDAGTLARIQFIRLSPQLQQDLLNKLPVKEGDVFQIDMTGRVDQAVREVDEHLRASFQMLDFDGERRQFALRISYGVAVEYPYVPPVAKRK